MLGFTSDTWHASFEAGLISMGAPFLEVMIFNVMYGGSLWRSEFWMDFNQSCTCISYFSADGYVFGATEIGSTRGR